MINIIKKHNVDEWFPNGLLDYFENEFKQNKLGTFKAPASVVKRFNDFATTADKERFVDAMGNSIISSIVAHPKASILGSVEFNWLLDETQYQLREAVADALQMVVMNPENIIERSSSNGVSTPNWSTSMPSTGFVMKSDFLNLMAKTAIKNSHLSEYEIVGDGFVGRLDHAGNTDQIVLHEWDATRLGNHIVDNDVSFEDFILNQSGILSYDKYDYVIIKAGSEDEETWRYEGFDGQNPDNWSRVDTKIVKGTQYLVFKHLILTGTKGDTGVLNFKGSIADKATLDTLSRPKLNDTYVTQDTNKMYVYNGNQWVFAANIPAGLMGTPGKDGQSIYFRAAVANAATLPTTGNVLNDVRITANDKHWHGWNGNSWVDFGEITIEYTFKDGASVATQDKAVTTAEFTILTTLLNGGTLNDVLTWDGTNVIWKAPTGTAATSGIETVSAFADIDATKLNKIYTVIDMDGVFTLEGYFFEKGEKGIVVVDSTGITSIYATPQQMWKEIVAIKKRLDAIESKANAIQILVDEHDNILKAIENTFLDAMGDKNKFTAMAGGFGSLDISAITGSEGVFDYTKGKKLSIQIGMPYADHGYDEHTLTVGDPATGYSLTSADGTKTISFRLEVNINGGLDVKNVVSNGIALSDLGIVSIQQNANVATTTGTPQDLSKYATIKEVLSDEAYFLMATAGQDTGVLRQIYFGDSLFDRAAKIPTKSTANPAGLVAGHQFANSQFNIYTGLFSAFKELRTPGQTMTIRITNGDVLSVGYIFYSGNTGNVALNAFRIVPTDAVVNSVGLELSFSKPDDTHSEVAMSPHANYKFQEASLPLGPTITTDTIPTNWVDVPGNSIIIEDSAIFFNGDRTKDWQKFFYDTRSAISAKPNSEKLMEITIQQYPEDAIKTLNDIDVEIWKAISAGTGGGTGSANFGDGNPTTDQPRAITAAELLKFTDVDANAANIALLAANKDGTEHTENLNFEISSADAGRFRAVEDVRNMQVGDEVLVDIGAFMPLAMNIDVTVGPDNTQLKDTAVVYFETWETLIKDGPDFTYVNSALKWLELKTQIFSPGTRARFKKITKTEATDFAAHFFEWEFIGFLTDNTTVADVYTKAQSDARFQPLGSTGGGGTGTGSGSFGDGADTTTQEKAVTPIQFVNIDTIPTKVSQADIERITGVLANLLTTNKGNTVNAINELVGQIAGIVAGVSFRDVYASETARDTALPNPTSGTIAIITGGVVDDIQIYNGTSWQSIKLPQIKVGPFDYQVDPGGSDPTPAVGETVAYWDNLTKATNSQVHEYTTGLVRDHADEMITAIQAGKRAWLTWGGNEIRWVTRVSKSTAEINTMAWNGTRPNAWGTSLSAGAFHLFVEV